MLECLLPRCIMALLLVGLVLFWPMQTIRFDFYRRRLARFLGSGLVFGYRGSVFVRAIHSHLLLDRLRFIVRDWSLRVRLGLKSDLLLHAIHSSGEHHLVRHKALLWLLRLKLGVGHGCGGGNLLVLLLLLLQQEILIVLKLRQSFDVLVIFIFLNVLK